MEKSNNEMGFIYSARRILDSLEIKNNTTTYISRRIYRIPGILENVHFRVVDIPASKRRGRPKVDYLLSRGAAGNFALICGDRRFAHNREKTMSDKKKQSIIELIEKCKVEELRDIKRSPKTYYYDLKNIYKKAKISRQFSTWINDIRIRNNKETIYIGSGFCKKSEDDYYAFLNGEIEMFVCFRKSARGRPAIVTAFAIFAIAEYEAMRYGVKITEDDGGPAHWCAVNILKRPWEEVKEAGQLRDEEIYGKADDDDGY